MPVRCEVELDIFSGMPNPTWRLSRAQASLFLATVDGMPSTSAQEPSGELGYRGVIVRCWRDGEAQDIHLHAGAARIVERASERFARDEDRALERWVHGTGRPHVDEELFVMVGRVFG